MKAQSFVFRYIARAVMVHELGRVDAKRGQATRSSILR